MGVLVIGTSGHMCSCVYIIKTDADTIHAFEYNSVIVCDREVRSILYLTGLLDDKVETICLISSYMFDHLWSREDSSIWAFCTDPFSVHLLNLVDCVSVVDGAIIDNGKSVFVWSMLFLGYKYGMVEEAFISCHLLGACSYSCNHCS